MRAENCFREILERLPPLAPVPRSSTRTSLEERSMRTGRRCSILFASAPSSACVTLRITLRTTLPCRLLFIFHAPRLDGGATEIGSADPLDDESVSGTIIMRHVRIVCRYCTSALARLFRYAKLEEDVKAAGVAPP